jgi:hypothetical protein
MPLLLILLLRDPLHCNRPLAAVDAVRTDSLPLLLEVVEDRTDRAGERAASTSC